MEKQKLLKRLKKAKADDNKVLLVSISTDLANLYKEEGLYELAIEHYLTLAAIYQRQSKSIDYAVVNRGIGEAYVGLHNFKKALEHLRIYLDFSRQLQDKLEEQRALATIGHTYLTRYLETTHENNESDLTKASDFFNRSLHVCKSLSGISSKSDIADILARLYANLGVVEDCMGHFEESLTLFNRSINLCKEHDHYEQLLRCYISLASLLEKKGDNKLAVEQYNLAIETAKKFRQNPLLQATPLLEKSQVLVKLGDFKGAKSALHKAYKLKIENDKEQRRKIEDNLRVVAEMCSYEDKILATPDADYGKLKTFYEKMGDGACELKNYAKALDYYQKMLEVAKKAGASSAELAICYYSLAETYKDNGQYNEAIKYFEKEIENCPSLKDRLNTLSKIADTKECANCSVPEIQMVYNRAITLCQQEKNEHEEGRMIKRCIIFLNRQNKCSEASRLQKQLDKLNFQSSDSDSDPPNSEAGSHIGQDVNLDNITDESDDSDTEQITKRRRPKNFRIKRNAKGETELHTACIKNKLNVVKLLLAQGHAVNVRDNAGWLPLHEACNHGFLDIVELLLENGAAINDRGGTESSGTTPLHDAASNGHLEVVQLLLKKGANAVAKTDSGHTVLDFLKGWRNRNKKPLDCHFEDLFQNIEQQLSLALEKSGQMTAVPPVSNESTFQNNTRDLRRSTSFVLEDSNSDSDSNGVAAYRSSIDNLRNRHSPTKTSPKSVSQPYNKRPALVEAEDVVEDWLEDDVGQNTKKRKTNSPATAQKRHSSSNLHVTEIIDMTEDPFPMDLEHDVLSTVYDYSEPAHYTDINTPSTSKGVLSTQSAKRKRKQQTKLTAFGHTRTLVEADSTSSPNFSRKSSSPSLSRKSSFSSNRSATPPPPRSEIVTVNFEPTLGVDVRISEKLYRVPVLLSQVNVHTIKWLADEAAARYARKEYIKPTLELETKNGAILANDDFISILFPMGATQAEPVEARIIKWNTPPLAERFKEACNDMSVDPDAKICQALEELSIGLDMSHRGLRGCSLAPLCKALNRQITLLELDLSGNFLTSDCVQLLSTSLPTLQNLSKLNLSCTGLLSEHLKSFVDPIQDGDISLKLEDLDLSDNSLTNDCLESLCAITNLFKIKRFNLSLNKFTENLFINRQNISLSLAHVECFNISDNELNNDALLHIIRGLKKSILKKLVVSRNRLSRGFLTKLVKIWAHPSEIVALETFEVSRCHIQDSEILELFRCLKLTDCLKTFDLSYNNDLTAVSLRLLLQRNSLTELNLIGCTQILKYFTDFSKYVGLSEDQEPKSMKLSADYLKNQEECAKLIAMWKEWYGDHVTVEKMSDFLHLYVKFVLTTL